MSTKVQTVLEEPGHYELSQWSHRRQETEASNNSTPSQLQQPESGSDQNTRLDKRIILKLISASFSFMVAGVNDGSVGAIIPYLIRDYRVSTALVSSIYAAQFAGWLFAAVSNTHLCQYLGLGSMLALGAAFQIISHALRAWMPPFGLFVTTFFLVSIGQAYNDSHANTFAASIKGAHRWLAIIHASYMAGCLIGPFVATGVATAGSNSQWYLFYTFPTAIGCVNLALILWAFRDSMRVEPHPRATDDTSEAQDTAAGETSKNKDAIRLIKDILTGRNVWLLGMFYFFYIGSQITMSGWMVEYLVDVRDGNLAQMGFVPAGFNGGCLLGRLLLAEPTYRLGERRMVLIYCVLAVGLQLVFWLVPNIIAASVAVSFIGFFTGPFFATGMNMGSKLFSAESHSTALAFIFVFAQMGGSLFPIITGVIASSAGVQVLQPILTALLVAMTIGWLLVPRPKSQPNPELHQE
ncbi:hypothetical protein V2G26_000459 [Clonostachys chloroleuca]